MLGPTFPITRRAALRLARCGCCALAAGFQPLAALATDQPGPKLRLPKEIAGVRFPDSKLAREAAERSYAESPRFLFNHCMRVFAFSGFIANKDQKHWDAEVVFAAAALHDMGLLKAYHDANKTFEAVGADFARSFALKRGMPAGEADQVSDGIARHTTKGSAADPLNVFMIKMGAGLDVFGFGCGEVSLEARAQILKEFPRLDFEHAFRVTLDVYKRRHAPRDAGEDNWIGKLADGPLNNPCLEG
jgi:hypothetical protein